ncbi:MAG: MFS transporter [Promethearchaeota archaeon]|nr:MAG: MFS transporter [Candidatus Lokiarchaeota archaeon]
MVKLNANNFLSFLLISIGTVTTITFGFVPLVNLYESYMDIIYLLLFWTPFGVSCFLFGTFLDKIKGQIRKIFCFSYVFWGILVILLYFTITNPLLTLFLIVLIAISTGLNVITAVSWVGSNIQITRKGLVTGAFLGLGWGLVSLTAYISFIDIFLNMFFLGIINIITGIISFIYVQRGKFDFKWVQKVKIPRNYNIKKNGMIYWISSLIFGLFLGVIVFLLGTHQMFTPQMFESLYLQNLDFYFDLAISFNMGPSTGGLINFDFIVVGAMNLLLSPIFGKLMDKFGRKKIFMLTNFFIPIILIFFAFWVNFPILIISVILYSAVTASYLVIEATVWSDLAQDKMARFNGFGWSSVGLGGALGFLVGLSFTIPAFFPYIDLLVIFAIIFICIISLVPFISMKDSLPPAEEMDWSSKIIGVYIINNSGIVMVEFPFAEEKIDANLFSGGISGITNILQEMVASEEKLRVIDHEDKKLLFEYSEGFFSVLLAREDLKILRSKLKTLTNEIDKVYHEIIRSWSGNVEVLKPIETMIKNQFVEEPIGKKK